MLTCDGCVAKDMNTNYAMEMCEILRNDNLCQKQVEIRLAHLAKRRPGIVDGECEEIKRARAITDRSDAGNEEV